MRPLISNPGEEYLLALLLQNPGLERDLLDIAEEYFTGSENREIFNAWRAAGDVVSIRDRLDPAIGEHFDALAARKLPAADNIEKRCIDCTLELRKKYLKDLAARKAASGEPGDDTARVEEDVVSQLREIYARRSRKNNPSASRTRR